MELDDVKQLVDDAAEARATRVFPPLIRASRVREEPMSINESSFVRVRSEHATPMNHPSEWASYDPVAYPGDLGELLRATIMPQAEGGAGFVLAGGALHHSLTMGRRDEENGRSGDLDFFPVGLSEERANTLANKLLSLFNVPDYDEDGAEIRHVRAAVDWRGVNDETLTRYLDTVGYYSHLGVGEDCHGIYRTPNAITIAMNGRTIQLITRLYPSREAVVRDFDIGPCQVLWDGFDVFMTELGALAYSTGCFPLELDHCTCPRTYARRLHKYLKRGYTLLLPDADRDRAFAKESVFIPGLGMTCHRGAGPTLVCEADDYHATADDEAVPRPTRPHLEVKIDDPWETSFLFAGSREPYDEEEGEDEAGGTHPPPRETPPCSGTAYLYRLIDYDPISCFCVNLVALVRGEAFRVLYLCDDEWLVCNGRELPTYGAGLHLVRNEIGALIQSFEYDHELRDAMTAFCPSLNVDEIRIKGRALLGEEEATPGIEWSHEPPRGVAISPDEWYGEIADLSWRVKSC
jgi:hypothetical protein